MADRGLTAGEMRVFRAYMELETHEKAAAQLGISTQTLKNHLGAVYKKLDRRKAHSALYRMCLDKGFDPLGEPSKATISPNQTDPLTDSQVITHNDTDEATS